MNHYSYQEMTEKAEKYDALVKAGVIHWEGFEPAIAEYYNNREADWATQLNDSPSGSSMSPLTETE